MSIDFFFVADFSKFSDKLNLITWKSYDTPLLNFFLGTIPVCNNNIIDLCCTTFMLSL